MHKKGDINVEVDFKKQIFDNISKHSKSQDNSDIYILHKRGTKALQRELIALVDVHSKRKLNSAQLNSACLNLTELNFTPPNLP